MVRDRTSPRRPDDPQTVRPDLAGLRVLAHPLRLRLLGLLRADGPATASGLATSTGQSSGVTSYHLRQLEAYGFVVDVPERGTGRDRWWRAAHRTTRVDFDDLPNGTPADEIDALSEQYLRVVAGEYARRTEASIASLPTLDDDLGEGWHTTFFLSDYAFRLTLGEAQALVRDLEAVVDRYRRDDPEAKEAPPADAARVVLQVDVLPQRSAPARDLT